MRLVVPTFAALTLSHPVAAWADAGGWAGDWVSDSSGVGNARDDLDGLELRFTDFG